MATENPQQAYLVKPVCLFAFKGEYLHWEKLVSIFDEYGFQAVKVSTHSTLKTFLKRDATYMIFLDLGFSDQVMQVFLKYRNEARRSFIGIASDLSNAQRSKLIQLGFIDILSPPIHPHTFKTKSINTLLSNLIENGIPEGIDFPEDLLSKVQRVLDSKNESSNLGLSYDEGNESGFQIVKGDKEEKNPLNLHRGDGLVNVNVEYQEKTERKDADYSYDGSGDKVSKKSDFELEQDDFKKILSESLGTSFTVLDFVPEGQKRLMTAMKEEKPITIWTKGQKSKFKINKSTLGADANSILMGLSNVELLELEKSLVKDNPGELIYFNFNLPKEGRIFSYLSKFALKNIGKELELNLKNEMFEVQRREAQRHYFELIDSQFMVKFRSAKLQALEVKALDISAGGLCVENTPELQRYLNVVSHSLTGECIFETDPIDLSFLMKWKAGHKIGFQFNEISPKHQQSILKFIQRKFEV